MEKPLSEYTKVIVETDEENPRKIAEVTSDDIILADGYRVRLTPVYDDANNKRKGVIDMAEITTMPTELSDTIELMVSPDYKERFIAEYEQTSIRARKLDAMLEQWDKGELAFKSTCPRSTYTRQMRAMEDYLAILEARAVMEGVELPQ